MNTEPSISAFQHAAQSFSDSLDEVATALHTLAVTLPRVIQQAADLGLLRETHDLATIRTVILGEQQLADKDHALLEALEKKVNEIIAQRLPCLSCPLPLDTPPLP